jgi:hypothetical protein
MLLFASPFLRQEEPDHQSARPKSIYMKSTGLLERGLASFAPFFLAPFFFLPPPPLQSSALGMTGIAGGGSVPSKPASLSTSVKVVMCVSGRDWSSSPPPDVVDLSVTFGVLYCVGVCLVVVWWLPLCVGGLFPRTGEEARGMPGPTVVAVWAEGGAGVGSRAPPPRGAVIPAAMGGRVRVEFLLAFNSVPLNGLSFSMMLVFRPCCCCC